MVQQIKMPSAGQTTDEARIVRVAVAVGDRIKRGDILAEAETDKAILPVESYAAGVILDVMVSEGDDVRAGVPLVAIGSEEDQKTYSRAGGREETSGQPAQAPAPSPEPVTDAEEEYRPILRGAALPARHTPSAAPEPSGGSFYPAMPNAKALARQLGVPLEGLVPANGTCITRGDVRQAHSSRPAPPAEQREFQVLPMTRVREVIGRRMLESVQTVPAWQCTVRVDMEACMELKHSFEDRRGVKLSYNDIMAKAIAAASRKYPLVNARVEKGEVRLLPHTNVGLAVALEDALYVPVGKAIDTLGLEEISALYRGLIEKARSGRLSPGEMGCGSITISNLGMYGVDSFTAIVNVPESCILAVGRIEVQPVWDGSQFRPVHQMAVTGSFDHRIIDGAYGAQFLRELKLLLEHPGLMLG